MERVNPFTRIYKQCNNGSNAENYARVKCGEIKVPKYLDIEFTNNCNFKCRFCPTGTHAMKRERGFMPEEVLDAICRNIVEEGIEGVRISRWGEPTMHPELIKFLKKLKATGALVHINTNGSILTEEQLHEIIDMKLDSIKFSFQGADEGTYNEMRFGGDFNSLVAKLHLLHKLRGDAEKPYIQVSTTLTSETDDQVSSFRETVGDYCDYYNIGYTKLTYIDIDEMHVSDEEKNKIKALREHETIHKVYRPICPEAFYKFSINWNGDVTMCCNDYDNMMVVGNVMKDSIKNLFTNEKTDSYRKIIASGEYGKLPLCSSCYETVPLQK